MFRVWYVLSFVAVFAMLGGGCPLGTLPDSGTPSSNPDGGASSTSGGGSSSSTAGATQDNQDFEDQLTGLFPDCSESADGDDWRDEILRLVNVERERAGLSSVSHNQTLEDQATQYACELIHYDFFDHENPVTGTSLGDRAEDFEYDYYMIGENLAAGQPAPAQAMSDWMSSEGHRENILNAQFTELGVGVRTGGRFNTYWVQEFGQPRNP